MLHGKSQIVQDELVRLGESLVRSAKGTRAIALKIEEMQFERWQASNQENEFSWCGADYKERRHVFIL